MARRMGISKVNVDRLFDLTHHSRLDHVVEIYSVFRNAINAFLSSAESMRPNS